MTVYTGYSQKKGTKCTIARGKFYRIMRDNVYSHRRYFTKDCEIHLMTVKSQGFIYVRETKYKKDSVRVCYYRIDMIRCVGV